MLESLHQILGGKVIGVGGGASQNLANLTMLRFPKVIGVTQDQISIFMRPFPRVLVSAILVGAFLNLTLAPVRNAIFG